MSGITPIICSHCGADRDVRDNFCGICGYQFPGSQGNHPTLPPPNFPQAVTRILDDTLDTFSSQPVSQAKNKKRRTIALITLAALLIVAVFVGIQLGKAGTQGTIINTPTTPNPATTTSANNTPTATLSPTPTFTPTPTSTPSPTPCPNPCVIYQETGSDNWANWSYPDGWRVVGTGILLGAETGTLPAAVAPNTVPPGTSNFAIEAVIAIPQGVNQDHSLGFGITACGSSTPNGWQGYTGGITTGFLHLSGYIDEGAGVNGPSGQIGAGSFSPGGAFHKYRLEIKGNNLTLKIDGAPVIVNAIDQNYLPCGPQVGIFDTAAPNIQIKSFTIILL